MGDWCGAYDFDAKDNDITGAVFITAMGKLIFMLFLMTGCYCYLGY